MLETLNNPHTPSRRQAIIFLIFALLVAGGLAVWELFINKGTLVLIADGPMVATVNGDTIECPTPPCSVVLKPREYAITFKRAGYFDDNQKIAVARFKETPLTAHFSIIPTIKKYTTHLIPESFPLSSILTAPTSLPNFPKIATQAVFNHSAQNAVLAAGEKSYLYSAKTGTITELTITPTTPFTWAKDAIIFIGVDDKKVQTIFRYGEEEDTPIVRFERALIAPTIAADPSGKYLVIGETNAQEKSYYLVDTTALSKKRLPLNATAQLTGFADRYALFTEQTTLGETRLNAIPLAGAEAQTLILPQAVGGLAVLEDDTHLIYIASEKTDLDGEASQTSIEEVILQLSQLSSDDGEAINEASSTDIIENIDRESRFTVYLTEFDIQTKKTKTLLQIPLTETQKISEMQNVGGTILMRIGKDVFELVK